MTQIFAERTVNTINSVTPNLQSTMATYSSVEDLVIVHPVLVVWKDLLHPLVIAEKVLFDLLDVVLGKVSGQHKLRTQLQLAQQLHLCLRHQPVEANHRGNQQEVQLQD